MKIGREACSACFTVNPGSFSVGKVTVLTHSAFHFTCQGLVLLLLCLHTLVPAVPHGVCDCTHCSGWGNCVFVPREPCTCLLHCGTLYCCFVRLAMLIVQSRTLTIFLAINCQMSLLALLNTTINQTFAGICQSHRNRQQCLWWPPFAKVSVLLVRLWSTHLQGKKALIFCCHWFSTVVWWIATFSHPFFKHSDAAIGVSCLQQWSCCQAASSWRQEHHQFGNSMVAHFFDSLAGNWVLGTMTHVFVMNSVCCCTHSLSGFTSSCLSSCMIHHLWLKKAPTEQWRDSRNFTCSSQSSSWSWSCGSTVNWSAGVSRGRSTKCANWGADNSKQKQQKDPCAATTMSSLSMHACKLHQGSCSTLFSSVFGGKTTTNDQNLNTKEWGTTADFQQCWSEFSPPHSLKNALGRDKVAQVLRQNAFCDKQQFHLLATCIVTALHVQQCKHGWQSRQMHHSPMLQQQWTQSVWMWCPLEAPKCCKWLLWVFSSMSSNQLLCFSNSCKMSGVCGNEKEKPKVAVALLSWLVWWQERCTQWTQLHFFPPCNALSASVSVGVSKKPGLKNWIRFIAKLELNKFN